MNVSVFLSLHLNTGKGGVSSKAYQSDILKRTMFQRTGRALEITHTKTHANTHRHI